MDFDDLLADPFEDPFAKPRSGSPDPWASFSHQSSNAGDSTQNPYSNPYQNPYQDSFRNDEPRKEQEQSSTTPTSASYVTGERGDSTAQDALDPLEADTVNKQFEEEEIEQAKERGLSSQTPGFRESISVLNPSDHTQTISEPEPLTPPTSYSEVDRTPVQDTPNTSTVTPASLAPAAPISGPNTLKGTQTLASESRTPPAATVNLPPPTPSTLDRSQNSPKVASPVVSPLEQPSNYAGGVAASSSLDRSFSGLALGGEHVGGWANEVDGVHGSWVNHEAHSASNSNVGSVAGDADNEDDEDDVPIAKTRAASGTPDRAAALRQERDKGLQPVFIITVDDPQKVGDPIRSFTMYTVHTRTTSPLFTKSSFSVLRRFSDFLWLYSTLSLNNPGVVVPPTPEKNTFGRFDDAFVQQRRRELEKCIRKIANHPVLGKDTDLRMFLESDSFALDIKHRKAEIAHERGGLMASIGQTIAGPRFYETDEWFDRQKMYLDSLEAQLRSLCKAIEMTSKQRSELSIATAEFATTISDLAGSDVGKGLKTALGGMADVERKAQDVGIKQSEEDITTIMSTVDEYARLINSVRLAFSSRIRTYHAWQNADADVRRVKLNHEKARGQGRIPPDRLGYSLNVVAESERRASEAKQEYDQCSKLIKSEVARFEQERVEDFKDSLHAFLEGMIARQKELIGAWEMYQQMLLKRVSSQQQTQRPPLGNGESTSSITTIAGVA